MTKQAIKIDSFDKLKDAINKKNEYTGDSAEGFLVKEKIEKVNKEINNSYEKVIYNKKKNKRIFTRYELYDLDNTSKGFEKWLQRKQNRERGLIEKDVKDLVEGMMKHQNRNNFNVKVDNLERSETRNLDLDEKDSEEAYNSFIQELKEELIKAKKNFEYQKYTASFDKDKENPQNKINLKRSKKRLEKLKDTLEKEGIDVDSIIQNISFRKEKTLSQENNEKKEEIGLAINNQLRDFEENVYSHERNIQYFIKKDGKDSENVQIEKEKLKEAKEKLNEFSSWENSDWKNQNGDAINKEKLKSSKNLENEAGLEKKLNELEEEFYSLNAEGDYIEEILLAIKDIEK